MFKKSIAVVYVCDICNVRRLGENIKIPVRWKEKTVGEKQYHFCKLHKGSEITQCLQQKKK